MDFWWNCNGMVWNDMVFLFLYGIFIWSSRICNGKCWFDCMNMYELTIWHVYICIGMHTCMHICICGFIERNYMEWYMVSIWICRIVHHGFPVNSWFKSWTDSGVSSAALRLPDAWQGQVLGGNSYSFRVGALRHVVGFVDLYLLHVVITFKEAILYIK